MGSYFTPFWGKLFIFVPDKGLVQKAYFYDFSCEEQLIGYMCPSLCLSFCLSVWMSHLPLFYYFIIFIFYCSQYHASNYLSLRVYLDKFGHHHYSKKRSLLYELSPPSSLPQTYICKHHTLHPPYPPNPHHHPHQWRPLHSAPRQS